MLVLAQRRLAHARVLCLLANSQTADRVGAQIISELKAEHGALVEFVGAGGPLMQPHLSAPALWSTDRFHPKPAVPFRTTVPEEYNWWLWLSANPFTKSYSKPMNDLMKVVEKERIFDKIRRHRPAAVITLDHDILSMKLHRGLMENYATAGSKRPAQLHLAHFLNRFQPKHSGYIDHVLYTMPIPVRNWNNFIFSNTYIGHNAFASAYQFLLSRDDDGKALIKGDTLLMHKDHYFQDTRRFVESERGRFRAKFNIPAQATVVLFSPGNKRYESEWALPKLLETADMFQSANRPANFTVVIPTTPETFKFVSETVGKRSGNTRFVVTESVEDKFSALAGANLAICYNGEIVTECLANQLPTIVIQNMSKAEFYALSTWNRFFNEMNILTDGAQYQEIIEGQCSPTKLNEVLSQMHRSLAHAFWPLEGFEQYMDKIMPMKQREKGLGHYNTYNIPQKLASRVIWHFAHKSAPVVAPESENEFLKGVLGQ